MFKSNEIPTDANDWLGETTGGANFFGYSNPQIDNGCNDFISAGLDIRSSTESARILLETISEELPFIPLFHYLDTTLISGNVCFPKGIENGSYLFNLLESVQKNGICN
jgi:ABC-type oligopeptide transport system substrate-binding subunit